MVKNLVDDSVEVMSRRKIKMLTKKDKDVARSWSVSSVMLETCKLEVKIPLTPNKTAAVENKIAAAAENKILNSANFAKRTDFSSEVAKLKARWVY